MKMNFKQKTLLIACSLLLGGIVNAATPAAKKGATESVDAEKPFVIQQVEENTGFKVVKKFPAKAGLTGWVLSQAPGKNVTAYTPKDNSVVILGSMLDASGKNWSKEYADSYGVKIDYAKIWDKLGTSTVVSQTPSAKKATNVIYVFKDANCGYCHKAYLSLLPYVEAGLEVRWVPVAFLAPNSLDKAAYLISATDKNVALKTLSDNFGKKDASAVYGKVTPEIKAALDENAKTMYGLGMEGTPGFVYKDKSGEVKVYPGMPTAQQLEDITGMSLK